MTRSNSDEYNPHSPDLEGVGIIPEELHGLGSVFFPLPPRKKGWNWPHHMQSHRFLPDSEELGVYFESGWGYGISCAGDLAVIDIDDRKYIEDIISGLDPTLYQWSGSGTGVHLFYYVSGMGTRINLHSKVCNSCDHEFTQWKDIDRDDDDAESKVCPNCLQERRIGSYQRKHIGEVKCDPHGYVVGPGSVHPSGNTYGPLQGREMARMGKDEFKSKISEFVIDDEDLAHENDYEDRDYDADRLTTHPFYEITADDVLPFLSPDERIAHPVHGSSTGTNFQKNSDRSTFVCWRCQYGSGDGCVLSAHHFLASEALDELGRAGEHVCQTVRQSWNKSPELVFFAWVRALEEGLVNSGDVPYRVLQGFGVRRGFIEEGEKIEGQVYRNIQNALRYELAEESVEL